MLRYLLASSALAAGFLGLAVAASVTAKASDRRASMVIDANTGHVLHAASADAPRYPASLTKMMTLYLAFEEIEQGRLAYATKIRVSPEAASAPPSKLNLAPGTEIALIDAIKALVTKSANDIAVAVAEHIAGSEANFAQRMTQTARRIGMMQTTFKNASGLPHPGQVTTARDMLTLALRLQDDFPRQYPLFATRTFHYKNHSYPNHNGLLGNFQGTDGIKTGYTRSSGFNLVSSVRRGSRHVVGAVFGGASAGARNAEMRRLLSRALLKASTVRARRSAPVLVALPKPATRPLPKSVSDKPTGVAVVLRPSRSATETSEVPPASHSGMEPGEGDAASPRADTPTQVLSIARMRLVNVTPGSQRWPASHSPSPAAQAEPAPGRGISPSTLEQQAANLARAQSPGAAAEARPGHAAVAQLGAHPYRLRGPEAPAASLSSPRGFEIQIGAYGSAAEAENALATARERASDLLAGAAPATAPIQKGNRELYRARFGGFSASVAANICLELRRRQIDCFVRQPE